jgi:hypothetical protein
MISYLRARNALPGKSRLIVGMWIINWIPLIIPQSWDKLAYMTVCMIAEPIDAAITAA